MPAKTGPARKGAPAALHAPRPQAVPAKSSKNATLVLLNAKASSARLMDALNIRRYIAGPDGDDWGTPDAELHRFHNQQTRELGLHLLAERTNVLLIEPAPAQARRAEAHRLDDVRCQPLLSSRHHAHGMLQPKSST